MAPSSLPAAVPEYFLRLTSLEDALLIQSGLEIIKDNKTVVLQDLKKRTASAVRYFKSLNPATTIKIAADKRNLQRRSDGRG